MFFFRTVQSYFRKLKFILYEFTNVNLTFVLRRTKMESLCLAPPSAIRNMTLLDKDAFTKHVSVPSLIIPKNHLQKIMNTNIKKYIIKLKKFDPVMVVNSNEEERSILLDPSSIKMATDIETKIGIDMKEVQGEFTMTEITLKYENWKAEDILKAILPEDFIGSSSFSIIGHILHLNLRKHLNPYKKVIAQIYLDKTPNISLVVNKADIIDNVDNTFRTFAIEKLAGETDSTIATVKENNCNFTFDFSKVYWNPRLSTEHERIINKLKICDILFDVMAGVGPFAIPAAKKKCTVFANDLNPASFGALIENCKKNKVTSRVECFNMDGNDFIKSVFQNKYKELIQDSLSSTIHVTMNLPSIAVEFLPSFIGLFSSQDLLNIPLAVIEPEKLPIIHVYLFSFNEIKEYAVYKVASSLGYGSVLINGDKLTDTQAIADSIPSEFGEHVLEVVNVRRVAPAKVMFRVTFRLPYKILIKEDKIECHSKKKIKVEI